MDNKLNWKNHIAKKRKQMDLTHKELYWILRRTSNAPPTMLPAFGRHHRAAEQHKAKQMRQLENKDYKETNRNFIRNKNKCLDDSNMYGYLGW